MDKLRSVPGKRMAQVFREAIEQKYERIKDLPGFDPKRLGPMGPDRKRRVFLVGDVHDMMLKRVCAYHCLFSRTEALRLSLKEYFNKSEDKI